MPAEVLIEKDLLKYVDAHRDDLVGLLQTLVRTPSENTPPTGAEAACQNFCASTLRDCGFNTDVYELSEVDGLFTHPLFWPGRSYAGRPNVAGLRTGSGGGRSLILSGHVDTVPSGTLPWTANPFSGHVENGRLYGRGSNDMKAGVATNLFIARALRDLGVPLRGDLTIESVVDEEFGGVNGTLAGRVRGYVADAAVISEPSFLRVCPSQRGGNTAHITFEVPNEGVLSDSMEVGVESQLAWFLSQIPVFARERRAAAPPHPSYTHLANPVPVSVLKIHTGPWGTGEPMATAGSCRIELYWQSLPSEDPTRVSDQFHEWFSRTINAHPNLFPEPPKIEFPIRYLPPSSIAPNAPLVHELAGCATEVLGSPPPISGIEGPCDMFIFQQHFGIPAVLWGARGGNTHMADEYVELETVVDAAKTLLLFVYRWCNLDKL